MKTSSRTAPKFRLLTLAIAATLVLGACAKQAKVEQDIGSRPEAPREQERQVAAGDSNEVLDSIVITGSRIRVDEQRPHKLERPVGVDDSIVADEPMVLAEMAPPPSPPAPPAPSAHMKILASPAVQSAGVAAIPPASPYDPANREQYAERKDNNVKQVSDEPVSTFSIDVDTGSYSNVRRMLAQGHLPPADAVRAEEFINYFDYGFSAPETRKQPFSVHTELAPAPWNSKRHLLMVGLKGYEIAQESIPASNLVFLIDTSGSMDSADKIGLLKQSFALMVPKLRAQDRISLVVYAGSAGLVLPPTPGDQHETILAALERLTAGGSTNGGEGITLAYEQARRAFIRDGVNRVILATDGDFNVGLVDNEALKSMVSEQRQSGVSLTTLGFGQGNYNDELSEQLADVGNGNHAYIDTLQEGHKVLVEEMSSTLFTIAKDVKIQIEFNPAQVAEYRLIGYENRMLAREDFNNDRVDAGEIGAGHDVTALYEVALVGSGGEQMDPLRYGQKASSKPAAAELAFLKLRYKAPDAETSELITYPIERHQISGTVSARMGFASAVAAFADRLRGGEHIGGFSFTEISKLARQHKGQDPFGYRDEFIGLLDRAQSLSGETAPKVSVAQ
ncbi:MAG: VWA domain-containing protein [Ahniella sp.]|nr:VWA domain-containing protein [Ahniella sp.]